MHTQEPQDRMCPNSDFSVGNYIAGVFTDKGTQRLEVPVEIDEDVYTRYKEHSTEWEENLRQFGACHQNGCKNWVEGHRCQVPDLLRKITGNTETEDIPRCEIRSFCRWYHQEGPDICKKCDLLPNNESLGAMATG